MSTKDDKFLIEEIFNRIIFEPKDQKAQKINGDFWELIAMGEFTVAEIIFIHEYWPKICQECDAANLALDRETAIDLCRKLIGNNANDVYLPTIMNDQSLQQCTLTDKQAAKEEIPEEAPDEKELEIIKERLKKIAKEAFTVVQNQSLRQYERFNWILFRACETFVSKVESERLPTNAKTCIEIIKDTTPILRHSTHEFEGIMVKYDERLRAIKPKENEELAAEESRRKKLEAEIDAEWADIDAEAETKPELKKKFTENVFSPLVLKELDLSSVPPRMVDFELQLNTASLNDYFTKYIGDLPRESFSKKITDLVHRMRIHATKDRKVDGLIHLKGLMHQLFKIYNDKFEAVLGKIAQKTQKDKQAIRGNLEELARIIRREWEELEEDFGHS